MIKDGKYIVHEIIDKEDKIIGSFSVKDNSIKFANKADELNMDKFPAGDLSTHTSQLIERLLKDHSGVIFLEKESTLEKTVKPKPLSPKDPIGNYDKTGPIQPNTEKIKQLQTKLQSFLDARKLQKEESAHSLYHIHEGPYRITSKPVTLGQIIKQHGSVQNLENKGFRLIPHTVPSPSK